MRASRNCATSWAASTFAATWPRPKSAASPAAKRRGSTLALIVRQKPNLLLLDEPTNHLDIEMREALTEALQDFGGALVVVAHDRHLLRATTDALWLVADGKIAPFDGDLDDYRDWVLGQRRRERAEPAAAADSARPPIARRRSARRRPRGSGSPIRAARSSRANRPSKRKWPATTAERDAARRVAREPRGL